MEKARRRQGTRTDLITNKEEVNNIPSNLKESEEEQGNAIEIAAKKSRTCIDNPKNGNGEGEAEETISVKTI